MSMMVEIPPESDPNMKSALAMSMDHHTGSIQRNDQGSMPVLMIDTSHIKKEPEDPEPSYPEIMPELPRPNTANSMGSITDSIESAMTPRYHRARYFRRNYASPECAVCEVCQAEFGGPDLLRLHKLAHFNTATVCYVCDRVVGDSNGHSVLGSKLMVHMSTHHKAISIPSGNYKPEAERAFVCPICLQRFSSNKILTLHTLKQHNQSELSNFTCKICSMDFISGQALQNHLMGSRHKEMKIKVQSIFMCVDCRAIFPARDSYAMHMMMRAQSESCTPLEECVKAMMRERSMKSIPSPSSHKSSPSPSHFQEQGEKSYVHRQMNASDIEKLIKKERSDSPCIMPPQPTQVPAPVTLKSITDEAKYTKGDFMCDHCNLQFFHPDTLQVHMKMMHMKDPMIYQKRLRTPPGLESIHQQTSTSPSSLSLISEPSNPLESRTLIVQDTGGMSWTCVACGYDFGSCDSLAMHVMDKHSGDLTIPVTSSALRIEKPIVPTLPPPPPPGVAAAALLGLMYKPPMRKFFENAIVNAMVSSQNQVLSKLPFNLSQLQSSHGSTIATQAGGSDKSMASMNNSRPSSVEVGVKRGLSQEKEELITEQPPDKQSKRGHSCDECKKTFETKKDLEGHQKLCGAFYSKCSFCQVSFHDKEILLQHLKHCNPETLALCASCGEEFRNIYKVIEHVDSCPRNGMHSSITCKTCDVLLKNKEEVQSHLSQGCNNADIRKTEVEINGNNNTSPTNINSSQPDNNSRIISGLLEHTLENNELKHQNTKAETKVSNVIYECKQCLWSTNDAKTYTSHMSDKHKNCVNNSLIDEQPRSESQGVRDSPKSPAASPLSERRLSDNDVSMEQGNDEIIQSLVQDAVANKRNKRKLKPGTRVVSQSPTQEQSWRSTESSLSNDDTMQDLINQDGGLIAIPVSPQVLSMSSPDNGSSTGRPVTDTLDATGHEHMQGQELLTFILNHTDGLIMCKYCRVIYTDRTMYYLHMGLHNLNNPWQCNLCGKVCANAHEFSSHVIHYR